MGWIGWVMALTLVVLVVLFFKVWLEKDWLKRENEEFIGMFRDKEEELRIASTDMEEAQQEIAKWQDKFIEATRLHSNLLDEKEQSIGDRHDVVILGDGDVFVAYYHGELVVGQKRLSFIGQEDDTYRFEVTFGNGDEGTIVYGEY